MRHKGLMHTTCAHIDVHHMVMLPRQQAIENLNWC